MKSNKIKNLKESIACTKGITLIALVVTIIVLLILTGVTISFTIGNNGLLLRANKAVEEEKIAGYKERIELIKADIQLQNQGALPTIKQIEEELTKEKWINELDIIMDKEIEKLEVISKEGYIFYVTAEKTEYKGKGEIVDTSALERKDVIEIKVVGETENGKEVRITKLVEEDYYDIKYQIDSKDGQWENIENEGIVEVHNGGTIYVKLMYKLESGKIHELSIENTNPVVIAKSIDTSNLSRKTQTTYDDLFDITWGSDGTGTIQYSVVGNLKYKNQTPNLEEKELADLELGTYTVKCKVISPTKKEAETEKKVNVTKLAETDVTNESGNTVTAKAIYSEYDLAYFRDLVNEGTEENMGMNAKLMNNINLTNVCSEKEGSWEPIGNYNATQDVEHNKVKTYYKGIFDGNSKTIEKIHIKNELFCQGVFGCIVNDGLIKNLTTDGDIESSGVSGGICGYMYQGKIFNCTNKINIKGNNEMKGGICGRVVLGDISNCTNNATIKGELRIGGIVGINGDNENQDKSTISNCVSKGVVEAKYLVGGICGQNKTGTIEECYNNAIVYSTEGSSTVEGDSDMASYTGGIVGINHDTVTKCINSNTVTAERNINGGIAGRNRGTITYCCNTQNVNANSKCGGIVGNNRGNISYVYNIAEEIKATSEVGGIIGSQNVEDNSSIQYGYNKSKISGEYAIGGIIATWDVGTVSNVYNIGIINATTSKNVGEIVGINSSGKTEASSGSTTETDMKTWSQETITIRIGNFVKQTNKLPILNIKVNNEIF